MVILKEKFLLNRAKANELNGVKTLNFWGAQLSDVSLLREVPNAEVINASANNIEYLEAFSHCTRLKELYLRRNNIKDIKEVLHLKGLKSLRYLWLSGNPFCEGLTNDEYRLFVLKTLPHLKKLDNVTVTAEQVKDALRCGYDVMKGSQELASSSSGELLPPIAPQDDEAKEEGSETQQSLDDQPSKLEEGSGDAAKSQEGSEDPNEHPQDLERSQDTTCSHLRSSLGDEIVEDPEDESLTPNEHEKSTSSITDSAMSSSLPCDDDVAIETQESSTKSLAESDHAEDSFNDVEEKLNDDEKLPADPSPKQEMSLEPSPPPSKDPGVSDENPTVEEPSSSQDSIRPLPSPPSSKDPGVTDENPSTVEEPSSSQDPIRPLLSAGVPCPSSSRKMENDDNEMLDEMNKIRAELGSKPLTAEKFYCSNQKASSSTATLRLSSARKKKIKKKNNLLTATLALVDELDEESLYLVKEQIEEKLQQINQTTNTSVSLLSSSTSSLDQSIGEISLDVE